VSPALVSLQRADGGWAQIPSLGSDAYSTGSALVALHEAGISVTSKTYRRGVQYLLKTQHADGSWRVLGYAGARACDFICGRFEARLGYRTHFARNPSTNPRTQLTRPGED